MHALFVSKNLAFSLALTPEWAEHHVQICGSLAEAQAQLAVAEYDVIVSNMRLADGTAVDLARQVRGAGLSTPLVVIGSGEEQERLAVLAAGVDDYVPKSPTLSRSLMSAVRAVGDRRRLDAANAGTELDVLYVGTDTRLVHHLEASPGVRVTRADLHEIPDTLSCQLSIVDAQGFEAAAPVWRIREVAPGVPIVLIADAGALKTSGPTMPFGVDDLIVRSYDESSQIVPRLRSLAAGRLPFIRAATSGGGVLTHERDERVTPMPIPQFTPSSSSPVQALASDAPPAVRATYQQIDWLQRFVALSRQASQADVATTVIGEIDSALAAVDQGADPRDAVARARSAATAFSRFTRWHNQSSQGCLLDAQIQDMTPLLTELMDGWGDLAVDGGAPDRSVLATAGELRRAVTALVVACRDSLRGGGTVHLRSEVRTDGATTDAPVSPDVALAVAHVRVVRVGFAAEPVVIPPALRAMAERWAGACTPVEAAGGCVGAVISVPVLASPQTNA